MERGTFICLVCKKKKSRNPILMTIFWGGEGDMYGISLFFFEAKTNTVKEKMIQEKQASNPRRRENELSQK